MARNDEISSTEKLLDLIRNKSEKDSDSADVSSPHPAGSNKTFSLFKGLSFKKKVSVGVDIGRSALSLAKVNRISDKKLQLVDYKRLPLDPAIPKNSPRFYRILSSALTEFCGDPQKVDIWSAISSINVETRYLRIPKVPKKQITNAVFWTYKRDISFSEQDDIFDYEVLGDILEDGVQKIEIMAYSGPKQEINELRTIFSKSGFPLTGILIIPFALQNLFRTQWVRTGRTVCTLFVGSDWSRIAIYSNGNLVLSRAIKAGIKSMVEALREELEQKPEQLNALMAAEQNAMATILDGGDDNTTNLAKHILFHLIDREPLSPEAPKGVYLKPEEIFNIILPALNRVVHQLERTIRHYQMNFGKEKVQKIYISGKISSNRHMVDHIGDQLGIPVEAIDPFTSGASISEDLSIPELQSDRLEFIPAVGMALSDTSITPNFIFTYKDKEILLLNVRIKRSIFGAFILFMAFCVGFYLWQSQRLEQKKSVIAQLEHQVEQYSPIVDQNLIVNMVTQTQRNIDTAKAFVQKYLPVGLISEISQKTPSNIKLVAVTAELGVPERIESAEKDSTERQRILVIDGIVYGERLTFDSSLAGYMVKLKSSPMLTEAVVKKKSYEFFENQEVLKFTAHLKLI